MGRTCCWTWMSWWTRTKRISARCQTTRRARCSALRFRRTLFWCVCWREGCFVLFLSFLLRIRVLTINQSIAMFRGLRAASSSGTRAISTLCRATRVSPSRLPFSIVGEEGWKMSLLESAILFQHTASRFKTPVRRSFSLPVTHSHIAIPSMRDMRQVVRTFTTAIEAKQQEASQQPSEADLNTLNKVMVGVGGGFQRVFHPRRGLRGCPDDAGEAGEPEAVQPRHLLLVAVGRDDEA